jgi:hypothetical protein
MPLPQVNERIKEVPAQALRAVFAGIGQVLLVAEKIRNRAVEQVSGTTTTKATAPPREAPPTVPSTAPAEPHPEPDSARRRSLDETGNVRLIPKGDEAAEPVASAPLTPDNAASGSHAPPADQAVADQAAADQAAADQAAADQAAADQAAADQAAADQAAADQAAADQAPADQLPEVMETPATPTVSEAPAPQAPAVPQAPAAREATGPGALPLSNYDELTIASLRARLRTLSPSQISILLEYEKVTEGRPAVITMFERRLAKLEQEGS